MENTELEKANKWFDEINAVDQVQIVQKHYPDFETTCFWFTDKMLLKVYQAENPQQPTNSVEGKQGEGFCRGEMCNREECDGVIQEHDIDGGCSCHINPPCSYCTEPKGYCPKCDWDEKDEIAESDKVESNYWKDYHNRPDVIAERERAEQENLLFNQMYRGTIPVDKYRAKHKSHSNSSQIIYGVHPNLSREEIEKDARGTFGGRFSRYNEYSFEYIAYTD